MNRRLRRVVRAAVWAFLLLAPAASFGQPAMRSGAAPSLAAVTPPGATIGKSLEWSLVGQNLHQVDRWIVSGGGVEVVESQPKPDGTGTLLKVKVDPGASTGIRELRALNKGGLSNLLLVRIDRLEQASETEPNDTLPKAQEVPLSSAVAGTLRAQDIDTYRIPARRGARLTIEVEAQRLGIPLVPVVAILSPSGSSLAQAVETPGLGHDCRLSFNAPADGTYSIQVRDQMYSGADLANYRLRVVAEPFATALFPLGGTKGTSITVTASGGTLEAPVTKTVRLPEAAGETINPGLFEAPGGPVSPSFRLVAGDGPEMLEDESSAAREEGTALPLGATVNGRISRKGEVDRYRVATKKGEPIRVRIRAAELGSWLDSVVVVRDTKGNTLAENDDPGPAQNRAQIDLGQNAGPLPNPDSRLVYEPKTDGEVTIEVADRYGAGGPEYGYRLEVRPAGPELEIALASGVQNANPRAAAGNARRARNPVGTAGAINLRAGATATIGFQVTTEGKTGPIEVRVEGLPPGVSAAPVTVRPSTPPRNARNAASQPANQTIQFKAEAGANSTMAGLRLVATAKPEGQPPIVRFANVEVPIDVIGVGAGSKPITRVLDHLPLALLGKEQAPSGPEPAGTVRLVGLTVPGPLLQGGRVDLALNLEPARSALKGVGIEARIDAPGLSAQTIVPEAGDTANPAPIVRVNANVDAPPGTRIVRAILKSAAGEPMTATAEVSVRAPVELHLGSERCRIEPGGYAELRIDVQREPGFTGPVELKVDGMPRGVKVAGRSTIRAEEKGTSLRLEMSKDAAPLTGPVAIRVSGAVRMPRGRVLVESPVRPMLAGGAAEE